MASYSTPTLACTLASLEAARVRQRARVFPLIIQIMAERYPPIHLQAYEGTQDYGGGGGEHTVFGLVLHGVHASIYLFEEYRAYKSILGIFHAVFHQHVGVEVRTLARCVPEEQRERVEGWWRENIYDWCDKNDLGAWLQNRHCRHVFGALMEKRLRGGDWKRG